MAFTISSRSGSPPGGIVGRLARSLFFAVFLGMGLLFLWLFLAHAVADAVKTNLWKPAPATILDSGVAEEKKGDYRVAVRYAYEWEGRAYTSDFLSQTAGNYSRRSEAAESAEKFPVGLRTTCYVDPAKPSRAVLRKPSFWFVFVGIIPLVFVAVGAGGIWNAWRNPGARAASGSLSRSRSAGGRGATVVFGGVFLVLGLLFTAFFSVPMWTLGLASSQWTETPCTIVSSVVGSHAGDDGSTYSVDIVYRYTFAGREYEGDRYDAVGGSSSGRDGKAEIVARYPAGAKAVCYVDPARPSKALLRRGFSWGMLFGLLPLIFVGVGAMVLFGGRSRKARLTADDEESAMMPSGPVELRAEASPAKRVAMMIFVALFWNGIVSVFVVQMASGFRQGTPDWFLTLFLVPFVLIGLGLIGAVVHSLLALGNPRVRLWAEVPVLKAGTMAKVTWEMTGAVRRIGKFWIYLEGREEATYRRGTSSTTDKSVFARLPIVEISSSWMEMVRGEGTVQIPADFPATFRSDHNKIVWSLKVRGEIARWPDMAEEYEVAMESAGGPA